MAQYKLSNEKWGETVYFTDYEQFLKDMEDCFFPPVVVSQKYAECCEGLDPDDEPDFSESDIRDGFIDDLKTDIEELDCDNHRIIMDNAGGIILQLGEWAHYYNGLDKQVAHDISAWIEDRETTDWEGHEIEALDIDIYTPYGFTVIEIGDDDSVRSLVREMLEDSRWDRLATALMAHLD